MDNKPDTSEPRRRKLRITAENIQENTGATPDARNSDEQAAQEDRLQATQNSDLPLQTRRQTIKIRVPSTKPLHAQIDTYITSVNRKTAQIDRLQRKQAGWRQTINQQRQEHERTEHRFKNQLNQLIRECHNHINAVDKTVEDIRDDLRTASDSAIKPRMLNVNIVPTGNIDQIRRQVNKYVQDETERLLQLKQDYNRRPVRIDLPPDPWWFRFYRWVKGLFN